MVHSWQWWGGSDRVWPDLGLIPVGQMEGRSVATLCLSSSHLYSGNKWTNHVPLSATSKWVLCPANRMVFIRLFESWAGLLGFAWTALFVPWEEVEEGKSCRAEEIQTCLTSYFFSVRPPLKETSHYLHFADLNLRSAGFSFQFWYPILGQRKSAVSLQPLICQASIGTNHTVNPTFSSKTWLLGSC